MSDLGALSYYLGIEVSQGKEVLVRSERVRLEAVGAERHG